jgi:ribosomal protein S27AE
MSKVKYNQHITTKQVENILTQKYPNKTCPECKQDTLYAGGIETQFDDRTEDDIVLSFNVFCKNCGQLIGAWDNTNRQRLL